MDSVGSRGKLRIDAGGEDQWSCPPISVIRKVPLLWFIQELGQGWGLMNRTSQKSSNLWGCFPVEFQPCRLRQIQVNFCYFLWRRRWVTFPELAKTRTPRKGGGKKRVEVGAGGAFSVHHQEILNLESGLAIGDLWSHRESSSSSAARCSWWGEFRSHPGEVLGESLTKRNRGKSLIYFYLEWGNRNLIFWPSHLEIAAELVRGVSGRPILCLFQNRRRGCTAVNNDKIWPVKLSVQWWGSGWVSLICRSLVFMSAAVPTWI